MGKAKRIERRLEFYKWVESLNDPRKGQHKILLADSMGAFLLTYEATFQFLKGQFANANVFYSWLNQYQEYDNIIKGLRTLRQFEAHIEIKEVHSLITVVIGGSKPYGTSDTDVSREWQLPELHPSDISKLTASSQSNAPDLNDWNNLVKQSDIRSIFKDGLIQLRDILQFAETIV